MKKKIKYVGFYDIYNGTRVHNLAAVNKMNYIADTLVEVGYDVDIISASWIIDDKDISYTSGTTNKINKHKKVIYGPSWGGSTKISRTLKIILQLFWLFNYLIFNTKKDESILVYHVQWVAIPIFFAKILKRFRVILEVEEIYNKVWQTPKFLEYSENLLLKNADSYIFVSQLLENLMQTSKKSTILYGSYLDIKEERKVFEDNNNISLIYAGSIDSTKAGAFNAVDIMKFLPTGYKLYIMGHGKSSDIENLKNKINKLNRNSEREVCRYVGVKQGIEYSMFLNSCQIALNPQNTGEYMNTAFPSKIISYLSHNLRVVTSNIDSIYNSDFQDTLYFAKDESAIEFAKVIRQIDIKNDYDSKQKINELHKLFKRSIKNLIEDV